MCKFIHIRNKNIDGSISGRGGATVAYNPLDTNSFVFAIAACHPKDNFCKHTGRAKAAGRLKSKDQYEVLSGFETEKDFVNHMIQVLENP